MPSLHKLLTSFSYLLFLKPFTLTVAGLLLIACGNDPQEKQNYVNGNAVKGIITNGIVSAYIISANKSDTDNASRQLLGQARTNSLGEYSLPSPALNNDALVVLELTTDSQSTMRCDLTEGCLYSQNSLNNQLAQFGEELPLPTNFKLLGYLSDTTNRRAFLSPLSHITYVTANSLPGGLSTQNINIATKWVAQTFDLENNALTIKTPDITALSSLSDLSDQQLQQGVLSAAFYSIAMTDAWSNEEIDLDSLPLKDIFSNSASLAQALSERLSQEQNNYASALSIIGTDSNTRYQELANQDLAITQQPSSISVNEEQSFSLHVQAGGEGPISYQWKKDDQDIAGANSSSYGLANASIDDAGSYSVTISNPNETLTSLYALVLVNKVVEPIVISQQPQALNLTAGDPLNLSVSISGDGPVSYQWQKEGSILPGQTNSTINIASSSKTDEGNYRVIITNPVSEISSNFVSVIVNIPVEPVSITNQPQDLTVTSGTAVSLTVDVTGGGFISYQWRKDGINIHNAYENQLLLSATGLDDSGLYDVTVSNSRGSITSQTATVSILPSEIPISITLQPISKTIYISNEINLRVAASGDGPLSYQWFFNGRIISGANQAEYSVSGATLSHQGSYSVVVNNESSSEESLAALITLKAKPSVQLTWAVPTAREDDSHLDITEISAYTIEYGYSPSTIAGNIRLPEANTTQYTLSELDPGTLYVRMATIDTSGIQGKFTEWVNIIIE